MIDAKIPDDPPIITMAKLEWLKRQCKSPRPRLGTLTLEAMADLALCVAAEKCERERAAVEEPDFAVAMALQALTTEALVRLDASIGGGN